MSELKTNKISTNDQNNVAIDNALGLKSYTTTQRDALTSAAGDMIYNSTTSKPQIYNGSAWEDFGPAGFDIDFLVIAGGGGGSGSTSGNYGGGGGGGGGYRTSYGSGNISGGSNPVESAFRASKSTNYSVSIGSGGAGQAQGTDSYFYIISSAGGGRGGFNGRNDGGNGGSSGGDSDTSSKLYPGIPNQGTAGGTLFGGGGGAGTAGSNGTDSFNSGGNGGNGGNGLASSITGSSVTRAGGGGGGKNQNNTSGSAGTGGTGGGGNGGKSSDAGNGTVNTGSGGGGVVDGARGTGGSGVVILRYATADATISVGAGLTSSSATDGSDTVVTFTAGTGTISFS